ncbi:hypothetical protein, partial [Alistipes shahii]|uniref:hypothetical protein n=1 Tax=Alistipes shahii TaxID=328814 RepID=UPI00321B224C
MNIVLRVIRYSRMLSETVVSPWVQTPMMNASIRPRKVAIWSYLVLQSASDIPRFFVSASYFC